MKWKNLIIFGSLLSVFVPVFLSSPSYAIEDKVITLTSSTDFPVFCDSSSPCTDYKYLIVEVDASVPNNALVNLVAHKNPSGQFYNFQVPLRSKYLIFKLDNLEISNSNFKDFQVTGYNNFSSGSIILTFTEDELSFGQSCPVCPEIPENPYDDKLDEVIQAIYVCAGTILVIYFFYCIYRMIIRSTGGRQ